MLEEDEIESVTLTEENDWKATFQPVNKTDQFLNELAYTIVEEELAQYSASFGYV